MKKVKEMIDYKIWKLSAIGLKDKFHWLDIERLLSEEEYSPYLNLHSLRLIEEFEELEDYEYCNVFKHYLDRFEIELPD